MAGFDLLPEEKIVSHRRPSALTTKYFWSGVAIIMLSTLLFFFSSSLFSELNSSLTAVLFALLGGDFGMQAGAPIIPILLDVIAVLVMTYGELRLHHINYFVTTSRVIRTNGIIIKEMNMLVPNRISSVSVSKGLSDALLGLGRVVLMSDDTSKPAIVFYGLHDPYKMQNEILSLIGKNQAPPVAQSG